MGKLKCCLQSIEDAGYVAQDGQKDRYEEIGPTAPFEEYTKGRKENREDDLDDVAEVPSAL